MRLRTTCLFTRLCTTSGSRKDPLRGRAELHRALRLLLTMRVLHVWFHGHSRRRAQPLPRLPRLGGKRIRGARGRAPFPRPFPAAPVENEKGPENARLDVFAAPSRVGCCLSLHWRQWQTIGAEPWVVSVRRDGYRIPFQDSLPPLARSPVSFPTYRPDSPRALALRKEVESMLTKGALEIVTDPGPGFYSRLFLVEKSDGRLETHD